MISSYNPLVTLIPAIRGGFGSHLTTFQAQIHPNNLCPLLGHDPRQKQQNPDIQKIYSTLPMKDKYTQGLSDYINGFYSQNMGAFPAISIGMTQSCVFKEFPDVTEVGNLHLELSDANTRVILDGLSRVRAAMNSQVVDSFLFPVTFFAPSKGVLTIDQLRQLFYEFNFLKTKMPAHSGISLDRLNLYLNVTNALGTSTLLKTYGGMEKTDSLGTKSTALVASRVLLRFVRGACEGRNFQENGRQQSANNPNLTLDNEKDISAKLEHFIDVLASTMGKEQFTNRTSVHRSAAGWQVLGLIFHELNFTLAITTADYQKILTRIGSMDWSRQNPNWQAQPMKYAGRTAIMEMLQYVRRESGLENANDLNHGSGNRREAYRLRRLDAQIAD